MQGLSMAVDTGGARYCPEAVDVRADRVLRIHGYHRIEKVRPRILDAANWAAEEAEQLARAEVSYRRLGIEALEGEMLALDDGSRFRCPAFARFLGQCDAVVVFVLTAGPGFDARIDELMGGDRPVHGLFLDTAGWLAVESITRQFCTALRSSLAPSRGITRRMGPGYSYRVSGDTVHWDLEQQHDLFRATGTAPVSLLPSAAMQPKMSRSGLYGLRPLAA